MINPSCEIPRTCGNINPLKAEPPRFLAGSGAVQTDEALTAPVFCVQEHFNASAGRGQLPRFLEAEQ